MKCIKKGVVRLPALSFLTEKWKGMLRILLAFNGRDIIARVQESSNHTYRYAFPMRGA